MRLSDLSLLCIRFHISMPVKIINIDMIVKLWISIPASLCSLCLCFKQLFWEAESRMAEGATRASHPRIPCCCSSCCSAAPGVKETRCTANSDLQTAASTHEGTGVRNWIGQPKTDPVGLVQHMHMNLCKHVLLLLLHKSTFITRVSLISSLGLLILPPADSSERPHLPAV